MKRILKLSFGLALMCAALMNQSCTKDYGADIAQVKKDLEALEGGQVASLADQLNALNASVTTLQQAKSELEKAIEDIKTKEGNDAKDIASLKDQVAGINSTIATIQTAISNIQKDLKDNYATQAWVKNSFATLESVAAINKTIGEMSTRISALVTKDVEILKKIDEVNTLANAAAIDAKNALGEIDAVKKDLADNYYKKGQIEGFIATLNADDEAIKAALVDSCKALNGRLEVMKAEIIAKIADDIAAATEEITAAYKAADEEIVAAYKAADDKIIAAYEAADQVLQGQIDGLSENLDNLNENVIPAIKDDIDEIRTDIAALSEALEAEIEAREAAIAKAIEDEVAARNEAIAKAIADEVEARDEAIAKAADEINDRIEQICADYDLKINDIAGRIVSISVLPTNEPELVVVNLGDQSQAILHSSFLVQPKSAVANLTADNFTLCVKEGLIRTKANEPLDEEYVEADFKDIEIDNITGVVSLTAFIGQISDPEKKGYYFALRADAEDKASAYSVTSDFALAIEDDAIDLAKGDWYWSDGEAYDQLDKNLGLAETEWTKFDTLLDERLGDWAPVLKIGDKYYTAEDIKAAFNLDVVVACEEEDVIYAHNVADFGDVNPMTFEIEDTLMQSYLKNNDAIANDDAKEFVGDTVSFGFGKILINDAEVNGISKIYASHVLTKVIRIDTKLDPITAYWNYINNNVSGKAEKDYTDTDWMLAIEEEAVAENVATFEPRTLAQGEVFGPEEEGNNYKEAIVYVESMKFNVAEEKAFVYDTLIANVAKENAHSLYKYQIPVAVQQQPFTEIDVTKDYGEITARITKDNELALASIVSTTLDPEMEYYLKGLEDKEAADVYAAFPGGAISNVKLNGESSDAVIVIADDNDSKVTFPAGELDYNQQDTLTFTYTQFNVEYNYTITFSTATPDLELVFTPYLTTNNNRAEVRGEFESTGVYTLETIYSSKLMRVEGAGVEEEGVDNVTVAYTEVTPDPVPDASDNVIYTSPISISATAVENIYALDPMNLIKWGDYKGREVTFVAQLMVGDTPVGEPKTFVLWTKKPVIFDRAGEVTSTRLAGQSATFNLFEGCFVYGVKEGEYVRNVNLVNQVTGVISDKYPGCQFIYHFDEMTTKINGVEYTLLPEVDYTINDEANGIITLIGDNVVGSLDITVPVDLWYYLDYNHTKIDTKYAVVHLNQK